MHSLQQRGDFDFVLNCLLVDVMCPLSSVCNVCLHTHIYVYASAQCVQYACVFVRVCALHTSVGISLICKVGIPEDHSSDLLSQFMHSPEENFPSS